MIPDKANEILNFWFDEIPSEMHFKKSIELDQKIREKFLEHYELASQNVFDDWQDKPMSCLALVILFDQFSRNMFRNDKKAYDQDHKTRLIVNDAVYSGYLENMNANQRFFMLMPLIHSEEISDHEMAYYLLEEHLREHDGYYQIKKIWKEHSRIIRLFHRYPHRNEILGRQSTEEELRFLRGPNSSF